MRKHVEHLGLDVDRLAGTAQLVAVRVEYPAELALPVAGAAAQFRPSRLLQIPTRREVARTSGV